MIVYLARDIPAFVMFCVNGESGSSLLIESIDSMIIVAIVVVDQFFVFLASYIAMDGQFAKIITENIS